MRSWDREVLSRRHALEMISAGLVSLAFRRDAHGASGQQDLTLPAAFREELASAGMVFDGRPFADFRAVRVVSNPDHTYSFAVAHQRLPFEARYTTRKLPVGNQVRLEYMLEGYVMTSLMNMAKKIPGGGADVLEPIAFDPTAVKEEFGADWGVTTSFTPSPRFSKYDGGTVTVIFRRETLSIGYAIYLYDSKLGEEAVTSVMGPIFHAMRFRG